jgi:hypothetical protein
MSVLRDLEDNLAALTSSRIKERRVRCISMSDFT